MATGKKSLWSASAIAATTVPTQTGDTFSWQWIAGAAISVVTFFLAWGLKDVKGRYDKVPELEKQVAVQANMIHDLIRRIEALEE